MFWYGASGQGEVVDFLKEHHGNIFFYGNKILKAKKEIDDNWVNAYTDLAATFKGLLVSTWHAFGTLLASMCGGTLGHG